MVVDLAPYRILLDRLKSEISALRRARNQVAENYVHQEGYIKLLYSLRTGIQSDGVSMERDESISQRDRIIAVQTKKGR